MNISNNTLPVTAIEQGKVIDHIPAGQGIVIVQLLKLFSVHATIGLNLSSKRMGAKDLIKLWDHQLTDEETSNVAVFAPQATVNTIESYKVVKKQKVTMPKKITGILRCGNLRCITRVEPVKTGFHVRSARRNVTLTCQYCSQIFPQHALGVMK